MEPSGRNASGGLPMAKPGKKVKPREAASDKKEKQ